MINLKKTRPVLTVATIDFDAPIVFAPRIIIAGNPKANNDIAVRFGGVAWLAKGNKNLGLLNLR
jgi:hypothetical protein